MTVALWVPGEPVPAAQTLFYRRDDETAFAAVRAGIPADTQVYKILPNGYPFLELLRLYVHHRRDPSDAWLDAPAHVSPDHLWLARNLVRLKTALRTWDDRLAVIALAALEKRHDLLHPDQLRFVQFCKSFVTRVMQPLLWGSPLSLTPATNAKAKAWWSATSDLLTNVDGHLSNLRSSFPGTLPPVLHASFHQWLSDIRSWLATRLFVATQADALKEASSLCFCLSQIHFSLGRHSLAVVYCHRAADLLLFSECAAAQLVDFTANNGGGELKHPPTPDRRNISILNCYDSLVDNGAQLRNAARRATFSELNSQRNLLLLTHFLGSVSAATAKHLLTDVSKELKTIGGTSWEGSSKSIKQFVQLNAHEFFDLSRGLMDTLVAE